MAEGSCIGCENDGRALSPRAHPAGHLPAPGHQLGTCRSLRNIYTRHVWATAAYHVREGHFAFTEVHGGDFFAHKDDNVLAYESFIAQMRERAAR